MKLNTGYNRCVFIPETQEDSEILWKLFHKIKNHQEVSIDIIEKDNSVEQLGIDTHFDF